MKLSQYIQELEALLKEHGDIEVDKYGIRGNREEVRNPSIDFRKILKGRESKPDFWHPMYGEECKGEKVVRV